MDPKKIPTEEELKQKLDREAYRVLREKGTEAPFSGKYLKENKKGTYACAACENPLFPSTAKYDSSTTGLAGWPSFNKALKGAIKFAKDLSYGMERTEILCSKCDSHLGHVFDDKEAKTGKHYCLNSVCLDLKEEK